ncbi:DUF6115 domain-containing protein [Halalkalibacter okhensis]|uniref:Swarming motility protein SwrB n=1 Tax=Halalkalibacter okhensis TaxID=333138 RepID=A0A0B0IB14_9BACI|nr:capsid protein p24 [Halalkalibacter okhensis]KHF39753.1 hypothetical protein LQ50_13005 [Halalkalibacter okhensis]
MTTLLITISLLLHAFTFLWILTLMRQQSHHSKEDYDHLKSEIEDLLVSYTIEMKEENEQLLKRINEYKDSTANEAKLVSPSSVTKQKHETIEQFEEETDKYKAYHPPIPNLEEEDEDMYQQSDTTKVIILSKQGLSPEQIAKKLNLGKGEVELMLKFYR